MTIALQRALMVHQWLVKSMEELLMASVGTIMLSSFSIQNILYYSQENLCNFILLSEWEKQNIIGSNLQFSGVETGQRTSFKETQTNN